MAGESRTWVHFGNPLRLTLCKQCVMPKAEEGYELLEIYLDKDKNHLWGHLVGVDQILLLKWCVHKRWKVKTGLNIT